MEHNEIKHFSVNVNGINTDFIAYLSCGEKGYGVAINAIRDNKDVGVVWFTLPPLQIYLFATDGKTWGNVVDTAISLFKERNWAKHLVESKTEAPTFTDKF